jgi:hypothetical protein
LLNIKEKLRDVVSTAVKKKNRLSFKCFIDGCLAKAINSHSQSLSNALNRIAKNGHVILVKFRPLMNKKNIDSYFKRVGVNLASTFKGFCAKHDNEYFKTADSIDQQNLTKESVARIAFRTFAYEERIKERELFFLNYVISNAYDLCDVSYMQATAIGINNHLQVTRPYYLNKFITMFESQDYEQIGGAVFILNKTVPLSCSTVIDPTMISSADLMEDDFEKPLNQVLFNLIPQVDSSLVIFAYFKEQELLIPEFIRKYTRLENIIFNHCEEISMSPNFYDSLNSELKLTIIKGLRAWAFWERQDFPDLFKIKLGSPIYI